ncbi:hypothetical protein [Nonomuraea rhodomycinica]|uniref:Sensor histidine kinase n=1 Tax=Nonomuraea rhodomycinica TaxID=1712872 RepID=A0A7Y6MFF9_9ACTN|nr:hypothetical protein [Nonomuraea rhodomycinica]NUW45932.1 hypothetical protein [Nonomuraea rhodomycinica]
MSRFLFMVRPGALRWMSHGAFGLLLVSALIATARDGGTAAAAGGALLGGLYVAWTLLEAELVPARPRLALLWLLPLVLAWAVLAVAAQPFVWLVLPIALTCARALPPWAGAFTASVLTCTSAVLLISHAGL